ncbi:MAG: fumarylacetoacetate hydrolase family protein [Mariniblastus sp.]|nr:fumarylacetoacetate hydrolase family protein [Mariniblastus sp.]
MKLLTFMHDGKPQVGSLSLDDKTITFSDDFTGTMMELVRSDQLSGLKSAIGLSSQQVQLADVELLAPISGMEKLICIGANYADHAREMGGEPPGLPVIFNKFPSAINSSGGEIKLPEISSMVDFEAELVVVIGKRGKHIAHESALEHVFGYCCGNDISARDWQKGRPGGQWLLGKTFDTFAPLGPVIVTRDAIADPHELAIQCRLNGDLMQDSNTNQLIFSINFLINHISKFVTLEPGDLLFTGTPAGVGAGRKPPLFLKPGDIVEVEVAGLGILRNQVSADR